MMKIVVMKFQKKQTENGITYEKNIYIYIYLNIFNLTYIFEKFIVKMEK